MMARKGGGTGEAGRTALVRRAPQAPGLVHGGLLLLDGRAYPCALGRSGITGRKREGDGATPRAVMAVLGGRANRGRLPATACRTPFWRAIGAADGWCDDPASPAYNRPVRLPWRASHERLARADALYDRLIVLDWNIRSRARWRGSAIFLHQARAVAGGFHGMGPTEGCIALPPAVAARLAPRLARLARIRVL